MLFCQLGHAKSLREICGGLAASEGKLRHLGLPAAPSRSTLAYANEHRPWQLQRTVFEQLLAKCQILVAGQPETRKKRKFRFKNPLLSLDATVIDLCATMFDWAKFRLTKGAVKLHLLLDHDGYLPSFAVITEGKKHEVRVARQMQLAAATVAAIYKERWQIELFFRALKQSLRVKTFVGTSANALKTQLWTALIAMLLVKYLQLRSTFGWSLSNLVALLRQQLFVYRDLWMWIDDPFHPPPIPASLPEQLTLQLA